VIAGDDDDDEHEHEQKRRSWIEDKVVNKVAATSGADKGHM